ncbi:MAG: urea carboxylase [Verrucomicrobiota bacterium]
MFQKVLIANRGAIAYRIQRTLKRMGVHSVAVYSEADTHSRHTLNADEAILIGEAQPTESYLNIHKIIEAAKSSGAQAIHPGYGFLSENTDFVKACERANITFIGPTAKQIEAFGLKHSARELAKKCNAPLCPGTELLLDIDEAKSAAKQIGYPIMIKSTAGGGGIGMQIAYNEKELCSAFTSVKRLGEHNFKNAGIFIEKYIERARHIEVQIFGDGQGTVIALGDRDCTIQRRNQKVIEEAPAPNLDDPIRIELHQTAIALGKSVNYQNAGTVEFIYDCETNSFYFLEVNTRLQVEHGVTEEVFSIDLVEWMLLQASGEFRDLMAFNLKPQGHAMQARIYAENPQKNFQPSSGILTHVTFPDNARCETHIESGSSIPPYYDPMIAKVIVRGDDRDQALKKLSQSLDEAYLYGIETNLDYVKRILETDEFHDVRITTRFLDSLTTQSNTIDVLSPGTVSLVVSYPGRLGFWHVGVPPSGPMDNLAFRLGNAALGNDAGAAGLELTASGAKLKFNCDKQIILTGAPMHSQVNNLPVDYWKVIHIKSGDVLKVGNTVEDGLRSYILFQGGLKIPDYLGSKTTFRLGKFGGHCGRSLQTGDVLHLNQTSAQKIKEIPSDFIPSYNKRWEIGVLYGPHGAPDFFTEKDIETFFKTDWKVHYNSDRTGIRLTGPKPQWARKDGGEAGLHPSNIHDNAYAIGAIDFTGDMPIILGQDGPSLGGFVCPATVVQAEIWKMGQLKPGDTIRFIRLQYEQSLVAKKKQDLEIKNLERTEAVTSKISSSPDLDQAILHQTTSTDEINQTVYRGAGDSYVLVEYGPIRLNLNSRFRAHALMLWLQSNEISGIIDLTPGIRSLQIHFDNSVITLDQLMEHLLRAERQLKSIEDMVVPTRIIHLPLSWNDPSTQLAIEKYNQSVRADAPWCPSNIEFIRRINGLDSIQEVQRILFEASYLVMGLGDVYLGAPVATPIDPRHRLVTTKYNPARTWTPENAVGIGGAYLCVYGMEGPGGYQFVGRTVQMWNNYHQTNHFTASKPWLLNFFDQIRFYPVEADDLLKIRDDFLHGKYELKIEHAQFSLSDYNQFLSDNHADIRVFKNKQKQAFEDERERWIENGQATFEGSEHDFEEANSQHINLLDNEEAVESVISGSVWKIEVSEGQEIDEGDVLVVIEAMKMETSILAQTSGKIGQILCQAGNPVSSGQTLLTILTD